MMKYSYTINHFPGPYPITVLETTANGTLYVEYAVTATATGSVTIGPDQAVHTAFDGLELTAEEIDAYVTHAVGIWDAMTGSAPTIESDSSVSTSADD